MEKIIIYTAITGGYDNLMQPYPAPEGFEFVCFVSKGMKKSDYEGAWKIEEIPFDWEDKTLLARSHKMNPHTVLPDNCGWSLWIDGNIRIVDDSIYRICMDLQKRNVLYAGIKHPLRDCVYQEMFAVLKDRREKLWKILRLLFFLRRKGLPEHAGLMESNVIFRKHQWEPVVEFDRWWWECVIKYSNRDQLTQTFALNDTEGMTFEYLFPDGVSARNFPGLEYVPHPAKELSFAQRKLKYGSNRLEAAILRFFVWFTGKIW